MAQIKVKCGKCGHEFYKEDYVSVVTYRALKEPKRVILEYAHIVASTIWIWTIRMLG